MEWSYMHQLQSLSKMAEIHEGLKVGVIEMLRFLTGCRSGEKKNQNNKKSPKQTKNSNPHICRRTHSYVVTEYLHDRPSSQKFSVPRWRTEMQVDFVGAI